MKFSNRRIISKKQYIPPSIYVEEIDVGDIIAATGGDTHGPNMGGGGNGGPGGPPPDDDDESTAKKYWNTTYFDDFDDDF